MITGTIKSMTQAQRQEFERKLKEKVNAANVFGMHVNKDALEETLAALEGRRQYPVVMRQGGRNGKVKVIKEGQHVRR